jgi:uncharacterized membrane protein
MAPLHVFAGTEGTLVSPRVRRIGIADLRYAVRKGWEDFWAQPTHLIFLAIIYPIIGILAARMVFGYRIFPLLFPLASGFALIGPFAAVGLYEMSRQRERGVDVKWTHALGVLHSPSRDGILALGLLLMIVFLVWVAIAQSLYYSLFGYAPPESFNAFVRDVFTTPEGWTLIVVGNAIGFGFAVLVLVTSVVTFPMLLDKDVGAAVAVATSVRAVAKNPLAMALWGLFVAVALVLGSLPFFVGLAIVVPVLAHASWHLYRRVVEY